MQAIDTSTPIGFIGLGVMGSSMASRLQEAGYGLRVHTRTASKAASLLERGAMWSPGVAAVAAESRAIVTMLGFPEEVEAVYFGPGGVMESARPGSILIDMTTTRPALSRRIHAEARQRGLQALDAPVSGGDVGAREGKLSIMVGGDPEAFEAAQALFRVMGSRYVLQGGAGSGQRVKLCNQIAGFGSTLGTCEALSFAVRAGLDPVKVLESIGAGAASSWALTNLAPRVIRGDFAPGFFVRHFLKDIKLALEEGEAMGAFTPGLALAKELYASLERMGMGDKGTQALYLLLSGAGSPIAPAP
ncbi:MAG: oxidoreductase [Fibrobacteres bacterium]|nr:oxidoreductase [Fibrobacterota bacterium]